MKRMYVLAILLVAVVAFTTGTWAADYYVIETRGGDLKVVDHKPEGKAEKVKGPFSSEQKAREAMKTAMEKRDKGKSSEQAKEDKAKGDKYYIVRSQDGEVRIVDHLPEGKAEVVSGPFEAKANAEWALKQMPEKEKQAGKQAKERQKDKGKDQAKAEEGTYYVVKGKGDNMQVMDRKPKEKKQMKAVKGPFESEAEARQAMKQAKKEQAEQKQKAEKEEKKAAKGQDKEKMKVKEASKEKGKAGKEEAKKGKAEKKQYTCLPPEKARRMSSYYVVEDEVGRMDVRSFAGDQPILFGPFKNKQQAVSAMLTGRCAQ